METTEIFRAQTDGFARRLEECCQLLCPRADAASLAELQQMTDAFPRRAGALLEAQQPFTLAVLGQVKAGKSSFLNALFFDGESVLPQAAATHYPNNSRSTRVKSRQLASSSAWWPSRTTHWPLTITLRTWRSPPANNQRLRIASSWAVAKYGSLPSSTSQSARWPTANPATC